MATYTSTEILTKDQIFNKINEAILFSDVNAMEYIEAMYWNGGLTQNEVFVLRQSLNQVPYTAELIALMRKKPFVNTELKWVTPSYLPKIFRKYDNVEDTYLLSLTEDGNFKFSYSEEFGFVPTKDEDMLEGLTIQKYFNIPDERVSEKYVQFVIHKDLLEDIIRKGTASASGGHLLKIECVKSRTNHDIEVYEIVA